MSDILAAEWSKLRTSRPVWLTLGVMLVFTALTLGIAWYFARVWDTLTPTQRAHASIGSLPDLLGWVASLVMAVFGALAVTSEFSSGMAATTFTAMPSRARVIAAKAALVGATAFAVTEVALVAVALGAGLILGDRPIVGVQPPTAIAPVTILAIGLSVASFALIGLGLGSATRSALVAVVALMLLWYIVPLVAGHVPEPWSGWLMSVLPGALAGEIAGTGNANSVFGAELSRPAAMAALIGYSSAAVTVAMAAVRWRDA